MNKRRKLFVFSLVNLQISNFLDMSNMKKIKFFTKAIALTYSLGKTAIPKGNGVRSPP
ncbi:MULTISPECIES: hypothetical protein [unclassified Microcoleus]|uniref:hypothetical protein n=1 Tax=unclassified Microcoleus TaxID=2642155 RepID=UPI002FCEE4A3